MWTDIVSAIGQILSVMISLIGFYYVGIQIRQANKNLQQSNHTSIYSINTEIYKFFAEHSDLRPYFHEAKQLTSDSPDANRVYSLSELMADFFEFILVEKNALAKEIEDPWLKYMQKIYRRSSAFRDFIHMNKDQYSQKLLQVFADIPIEEFDFNISVREIRTRQELLELDALYQQVFSHSSVPTERQLQWWATSSVGVLGLFQGKQLIGGLSIWPVSFQLYQRFCCGELKEKDIRPEDIQKGSRYFYFSDFAIDEGCRNRHFSDLLLRSMIQQISVKHENRYKLRLLALAYSDAGRHQLVKLGFAKLREASDMPDNQDLFQLEIVGKNMILDKSIILL